MTSEEPEGEDLFDDNNLERYPTKTHPVKRESVGSHGYCFSDYRAMPELDKYDEKMLDSG